MSDHDGTGESRTTPDGRAPKEPGFLLCGLMVFGGLLGASIVVGFIASLTNNYGSTSAIGGLVVVGIAISYSVQSARFRRCLLKGLAVVSVVLLVLFGACYALIVSSY